MSGVLVPSHGLYKTRDTCDCPPGVCVYRFINVRWTMPARLDREGIGALLRSLGNDYANTWTSGMIATNLP
jgi:hypothetical protein